MRTPPAALAVSRVTFVSVAPQFVPTTTSGGTFAIRSCAGCAVFYAYENLGGGPGPRIPTTAPFVNVTAIALQPSAGNFVCAVSAPSGALSCSNNAFGRVPNFGADQPPAGTPCSLVAVTETAVCATLAASGWLWCSADDITPFTAAATSSGLPTATPPGTNAARALLVQVNVTAVAASEAIFCFVYNSASAVGLLGCIGPVADPVLAAAISGISAAGLPGGLASLSEWAASRGSSGTQTPLRSVSVGAAHACVLAMTGRPWCWGTDPTAAFGGGAVGGMNADSGRYLMIAAGGNSTCGQQVDGRLRCFGLLSAYVQDAQRGPAAIGNSSAQSGSGSDDLLLPVTLAGMRVLVSASRGNDTNCSCERLPDTAGGEADSTWAAQAVTPCATFAGALAAATRAIAASADTLPSVQVWINGTVSAAAPGANATFATPRGVALLQISGIVGSGAVIIFQPCWQATGSAVGALAPAACITAADFVLPGLIVKNVVLRPADATALQSSAGSTSSEHCISVVASSVATRLVNVSFEGWNCSGALIALRAPASTVDSAFAWALSYLPSYDSGTRAASAIAGGLTAEVVGARFERCSAAAGIAGIALPGIRIAGVVANASTFESVALVDQVLYVRVDGMRADALTIASRRASGPLSGAPTGGADSTLLPGSAVCGGVIRVNNVANTYITSVAVRGLRMSAAGIGGGAVCITDFDHAATRASRPRLVGASVEGVTVSECFIGGGGCAVYAAAERSPSAILSISSVTVSRSAVSGDGGAIFVSVPTASILNVTCADSLAAGARGGGCIGADGCASLSISALAAERSVALLAGGAVWVRAGNSPSAVSVRSAEFADTAALAGDGGALYLSAASSVSVAAVACRRASAPRGSGGCAAIALPVARGTARASVFDMRRVSARECSSAYRGGGLAVTVGVLPGDSSTLTIASATLTGNTVGSIRCNDAASARIAPVVSRAPAGDSALWWNATLAAVLNETVASGTVTAADLICAPPDDADVGGGAVAVAYTRGRTVSAAAASSALAADGVASPRVGLTDVLIEGNTAGTVGDALGRGGGLLVTRSETAPSLALLSLRRVTLLRNWAAGSGGGAALRSALASAANTSVVNCTSAAGDGGGIFAADAALTAAASFVLAHNRAESGSGGGAALSSCILSGLQLLGEMRHFLAPSASVTPSVTASASVSATSASTQTPSVTASVSGSKTVAGSASNSRTPSPTGTATATRSLTGSGTASATISPSRTPSASPWPRPGETAVQTDALTAALSRWLIPGVITVANNSAAVSGGGLALVSCDAVVGGVTLLSNVADEGGGASAAGSGSLHLCAALFALNRASAYGGGLALADVTRESHLCDEAGCARFLLLSSATGADSADSSSGTGGAGTSASASSGLPRLPFRILLAALTTQARQALSTLGIGDALTEQPGLSLPRLWMDHLRGAVPPAPPRQSVEAVWIGLQAAAETAAAEIAASAADAAAAAVTSGVAPSLAAAAAAGAGDGANCAWAANAGGGPGGDVSIRSTSSAAIVAAAGRPVTYLRKALLYAGTSGAAGGAIYVAVAPVSLSALDIVALLAGDIYTCILSEGATAASISNNITNSSNGGLFDPAALSACNASLTASSSAVVSASASLPSALGFGGAVALLQPVYAEVVALRCVSAAARFGGTIWVQPFEPAASTAVSVSADATVGASTPQTGAVTAGLPRLGSSLLLDAVQVATARAVQAAAALAAGRSSAALPAAPLDGRVLLGSLALRNSSSAAGGGSLFVHGALRNTSAAAVAGLTTVLGKGHVMPLAGSGPLPRPPAGARVATLPVAIHIAQVLPSSVDSGAVALVSLSPAPGPLAILHLRDAMNETAAWDDDTFCIISVVSGGIGSASATGSSSSSASSATLQDASALSLMYPARYVARSGIVTLSPFGIASAPGSTGEARVTCSIRLGDVAYDLTTRIAAVTTVRVRLQLDAIAAAGPLGPPSSAAPASALLPFCNSTRSNSSSVSVTAQVSAFSRPAPGTRVLRPVLLPAVAGAPVWEPDWHVRLTLTDAAGSPVAPPAALPCTLQVQAAVDAASGNAVSAALVALAPQAATSVELAASTASAPVAVAGAAGALINISASCRWPSGETVNSAAPLMVETARLELAWVLGIASIGVQGASPSNANSSAAPAPADDSICADWSLTCGNDGAQAGCPLTLQGASASASAVSGSSSAAAPAPASLASWAAEPAWTLNVTAQSAGGAGQRTMPNLLGVRADPADAGSAVDAAFPRSAGAAASILVLAVSPGSGSSAGNSDASGTGTNPLLEAAAWSSDWSRSPAAALAPAALPSSTDGLQLLPLRPAPAFALVASHPALPARLVFRAGSGTCTAALVPAQPTDKLPAFASVVGTATGQLVAGGVALAALGVTSLPIGNDTSAQLRVACSLSGGEAQTSVRVPLRVPALQAIVASAPPALIAPSSDSALAPLLQPLVYALIARRAGCGSGDGNSAATGSGGSMDSACATPSNSTALADASVSATLRSVGAKVSCSLACERTAAAGGAILGAPAAPCTLSGRTSALLDVSGAQTLAATASFAAFGLSEVARYSNASCVSAVCTWLDGQRVSTPPVCTAQPSAFIVWCDLAGADCGPSAPGNVLPSVTVANEPLPSFAIAVRTNPPNGLAALQLADGTLRCALTASVDGVGLGNLLIRSGEAVADPRTGLAIMSGTTLQLTPAQAVALDSQGVLNVQLSASCTVFGLPFASSSIRSMRLPQLRAAWLAAPPAVILPATATAALPVTPTVRVALADAANASSIVDVAGSCTVSIVQRWLPPDAVAVGAAPGALDLATNDTAAGVAAFALLLGSTTRPLFRGEANFPDLALAASMGATVTLRASCVRAQGGDVAPSEWNVSVAHAAVAWDGLPPLLLSGRRLPVSLHVSWRIVAPAAAAAKAWQWTCDSIAGVDTNGSSTSVAGAGDVCSGSGGGSPIPVGFLLPADVMALSAVQRVPCSLALEDVSPDSAETAALAVQFSSLAVSANASAADTGVVALTIDVAGAGGRSARLQPVCTIGGHSFRAPARVAGLATVAVAPIEALPGV